MGPDRLVTDDRTVPDAEKEAVGAAYRSDPVTL
jgi:hypothetical protein